jgi:hypothetical protein
MAGLKVLTREQMLVTPGMPSLEVELGTFKGNQSPIQEIYSYSLNVSLDQIVNLTRDPQVSVDASTWWTAKVGVVGAAKLNELRNAVNDHVDKFINAWLSVNPK